MIFLKNSINIIGFILFVFSFPSQGDVYNCHNYYQFYKYDTLIKKYVANGLKKEPSPQKVINIEGELPTSEIYLASKTSLEDMKVMQMASVGWVADIDRKMALRVANKYLMAWVESYQPNYNPIDEESFGLLFQSYAMIKDGLTSGNNAHVSSFLKKWAEGYFYEMDHKDDNTSQWKSNWQSNRIRIVTFIAIALDDKNLLKKSKEEFLRQVGRNINYDGSTWDFYERDAIKYVIADLTPLIDAALAAKGVGDDWYNITSGQGGSLKKAVHWLLPYTSGIIKHTEFKNTKVYFDKLRARDNVNGFRGDFNPMTAANLLWMASLLEPSLEKNARELQRSPPFFYQQCFK